MKCRLLSSVFGQMADGKMMNQLLLVLLERSSLLFKIKNFSTEVQRSVPMAALDEYTYTDRK